jgi:uncharacterized protein (TIGR00369 family)
MAWTPEINPEFALPPKVTEDFTSTTFPGWLGFVIAELGPNRVIGKLEVDDAHTHPGRHMHGGALAAFADSIAGWGTARRMRPNWNFTTAEMKVNSFKRSLPGDVLWGVGEPLHVGHRTQVWEVRLLRDAELVGNFICTQIHLAPRDPASAQPRVSTSEVPPVAVGVDETPGPPPLVEALPAPSGPYIDHLGIEALEVGPDRVVARMAVDERHLHSGHYVHGGVWATFADQTATWATRQNLPAGAPFATAEFKVNLFGAGQAGHVLEAEATPLHRGRRTHVWNVMIRRDSRVVAQGTVTQMIVLPREDA